MFLEWLDWCILGFGTCESRCTVCALEYPRHCRINIPTVSWFPSCKIRVIFPPIISSVVRVRSNKGHRYLNQDLCRTEPLKSKIALQNNMVQLAPPCLTRVLWRLRVLASLHVQISCSLNSLMCPSWLSLFRIQELGFLIPRLPEWPVPACDLKSTPYMYKHILVLAPLKMQLWLLSF